MYEVIDNDIYIIRGDTAVIPFSITRDGSTYDFSNDLVQFTVKRNTVTQDIVIQKTITGASLVISPEDTHELPYEDFTYDVQMITEAGEVHTVIKPHLFKVTNEVNFAITAI